MIHMCPMGVSPTERTTVMTTTTFNVEGMTCGHCVAAVTEELSKIAGVTAVDVDLKTGEVGLTSDVPVERSVVEAAVDEAGYVVAP